MCMKGFLQGGSVVRFKRLLSLFIIAFMFAGLSIPAQACTAIYAGSEMTETGDTVFGRIEDFSSDYPKLFDVYPAGAHQAGETYRGCYGFSWTFTHDSYSYTGFCSESRPMPKHMCSRSAQPMIPRSEQSSGSPWRTVGTTFLFLFIRC